MNFIDTHTHLYDEAFGEDAPHAVERAFSAGAAELYLPNVNEATVEPMMRLCAQFPDKVFPMMGLQPEEVREDYRMVLDHLWTLLSASDTFIAVGEVGLDFYWDRTYEAAQRAAFDIELQWASTLHLPLSIHARGAHRETIDMLTPYKTRGLRGVFHSFTGTAEEAKELLQFDGFMLGINGIVTFKKSTLPEALRNIPMERLVVETDSPYLAPVPHRGKRNESAFAPCVIAKLAEIYDCTVEQVAETTSATARRVFGRG
jgi:TatD DNase family protein